MSDFKAKIHQNRFRLGLPQTRLGELTALPKPSSWNKGDLLLREGDGCRKRKGKTRRESEERGKMKTMNTIQRRCGISVILAPSIHIPTYLLLIYLLIY